MNVAQTRPSNVWRWLVLGLCLLSFGKGVWDLGEQSLWWWDESPSYYRALSNRMTFINGDLVVPITSDNHPPLHFGLLRLVFLAARESEFALLVAAIYALSFCEHGLHEHLRVGMYDRYAMLRLPVYDTSGWIVGDRIAVTQLEVTRP